MYPLSLRSLILILFFAFASYCNAQDSGQLISLNGAKLYVRVKGEGEPLIVIPGGPGLNHSYFIPYLESLEKNFKVVYFDQRASGKSSTPGPDSVTMKFFSNDIEAIRKHFGFSKVNVLGHSWGAVVAVSYATDHTQNVKTLVLSNPAPLSREYDVELMQLNKKRMSKADSTQRAQLMRSGPMTAEKFDQLMKLTFKMSAFNRANMDKLNLSIPEEYAKANQSLFGGLMKDAAFQKNLYTDLKKFNFPVLIITGAVDITSASALNRLKSSLPKAKMETFTESGHFPFVEETKKFNKVVAQFIKRNTRK